MAGFRFFWSLFGFSLIVVTLACGTDVSQTRVEEVLPHSVQIEKTKESFWISDCPINETERTLTREQKELFSWFDTLEFPDITCRKLVRVTSAENRGFAFLVADDVHSFSVLTLDLHMKTYERIIETTTETKMVTYAPVDLKNSSEEYHFLTEKLSMMFVDTHYGPEYEILELDLIQRKENGDDIAIRWYNLGVPLPTRIEVFVLARACAAAGYCDLASRLYYLAESHIHHSVGKPPNDLRLALEKELAHLMTWRAVLAFEDLSIPRRKLLDKFQWLKIHFPLSEHSELVDQTIKTLDQMVAEDLEHEAKEKKFEVLSGDVLVTELIFQLRNQNGHQHSQPGSCDVFSDERGENSPANRLVAIGYPAIPKLIDQIENNRLSRSVERHRDFVFTHDVLTVGEVALAVIERISGLSFYSPGTNSTDIREKVKNWWVGEQKRLKRFGDEKARGVVPPPN